ncbi:MAG: four helix bundle protein [Bacteroidota bacterium]|nr:four helix bundle protein [Bacteroidota bacterium]
MFLKLAHTRLDVYKYSRQLALEVYKITKLFPDEERYTLSSQIRRAALSVHLNISEGSSRKSENERKRFYEIARGSVIEVDTAIGFAFDLKYVNASQIENLGSHIINSFKVIAGLINKNRIKTNL